MAKTQSGKKFIRVGSYWRNGSLVRAHVRSTPNIVGINNSIKGSIFTYLFRVIILFFKFIIDCIVSIFMIVFNMFLSILYFIPFLLLKLFRSKS